MLLLTGVANAGRKRVVVLDFEGDKAEQFHADLVKLIKKNHTVVSTDKWNGAAEEMSATKLNEKNVKKVAKKLKVDGVVSGVVEKRRDEYILRIKLRSGVSGEMVGSQVNIKSDSAKLDTTAAKDVKDELIEVIAGLESNREGGGEEEEEDKPKKSGFGKKKQVEEEEEDKPKKTAKKTEEEEEDKPKKSGFGKKKQVEEEEEDKPKKTAKKSEDEEDKPKKTAKKSEDEEDKPKKTAKKTEEEDKPKKTAKKTEEEDKPKKTAKKTEEEVALKTKKSEEEDDNPLPKKKKAAASEEEEEDKPAKKKVASAEGELEGGEVEENTDGPGMDAAKAYSPGERAVDAAVGLSFTGRRMSFRFDPGQVTMRPAGYKQFVPLPGVYIDATIYPLAVGHKREGMLKNLGLTFMFDRIILIKSEGTQGGGKLNSTEQRFAIGATFRYPLGKSASAPVIGGSLEYGAQKFTIDGMAGIPNVNYKIIEPSVFFQYPVSSKLLFHTMAGLLAVTDAGAIVTLAQYGRATVTGLEFSAGVDYQVTKNIFARAAARFETLGYSFKGEGMMSTGVVGARDSYFGGVLTAGYLY